MYRGHRISVVIPCHNEEEGVRAGLATCGAGQTAPVPQA